MIAGSRRRRRLRPASRRSRQGDRHPHAADRLVRHRRPDAAPRHVRSEDAAVEVAQASAEQARRRGHQGSPLERHPAHDDRAAPRLSSAMTWTAPLLGRSEAVDSDAMQRITAPRRVIETPAAKAASDAAKADAKPEAKPDDARMRKNPKPTPRRRPTRPRKTTTTEQGAERLGAATEVTRRASEGFERVLQEVPRAIPSLARFVVAHLGVTWAQSRRSLPRKDCSRGARAD